jgi:hypothetical protein
VWFARAQSAAALFKASSAHVHWYKCAAFTAGNLTLNSSTWKTAVVEHTENIYAGTSCHPYVGQFEDLFLARAPLCVFLLVFVSFLKVFGPALGALAFSRLREVLFGTGPCSLLLRGTWERWQGHPCVYVHHRICLSACAP